MAPAPDRRRLAEAIVRHRAEVLGYLYQLEWAADPKRPDSLIRGDDAAHARAEVFLDCLVKGLAEDDWRTFDRVIVARNVELLVKGVISAEQLNSRALLIATRVMPIALAEPDPHPLLAALFEAMQAISGRIVGAYNARLLAEAEQLDDLKTMFMRMTGHEMRAPLGTIRGYASMVSEGDFGELTTGVRAAVQAIDESAASAINMIDRLSEMARLESRREALHLEPHALAEILAVAIEPLQAAARQKGVKLQITADPGEVLADREELAIAVRNLLGNALKYAGGGLVEISAAREGNDAVFEVRDHGPGIPAEELPLIFERYYRSVDTRAREIPGSGLGLYIVKRVAELHGGDASATSEPGDGAAFRIRIPAGISTGGGQNA